LATGALMTVEGAPREANGLLPIRTAVSSE
jgi:hypothetical protein